jgi:hypothetical protein
MVSKKDVIKWEKTVAKIPERIEKAFEEYAKSLKNDLRKLGLTLTNISFSEFPTFGGLTFGFPQSREIGNILARFKDTENYPITVLQTLGAFVGPKQIELETPAFYRSSAIWGTVVKKVIPFTLRLTEVGKKSFFGGTAQIFLPLTHKIFNRIKKSEEMTKQEFISHALLQTPLLRSLNNDTNLSSTLSSFQLKRDIGMGYSHPPLLSLETRMTQHYVQINCSDLAGKCVIIPFANETAIFLRHVPDYSQIKTRELLDAIHKIRNHILNSNDSENVTGIIPEYWINSFYSLCRANIE